MIAETDERSGCAGSKTIVASYSVNRPRTFTPPRSVVAKPTVECMGSTEYRCNANWAGPCARTTDDGMTTISTRPDRRVRIGNSIVRAGTDDRRYKIGWTEPPGIEEVCSDNVRIARPRVLGSAAGTGLRVSPRQR